MLHIRHISFKNAFQGARWTLENQPHFKIHLVLSCIALIACYILQVSYIELLIVIALIFIGLTVESINTAIEQATDAIDVKWRQDIKLAKDTSAGSMLIFSIGAFIIACIIFIPRILALIH